MTTDNMTMERKCEQLQSPENPRLKILSFLSLPFKKKKITQCNMLCFQTAQKNLFGPFQTKCS